MDHTKPWLSYIDAVNVRNAAFDLDGMKVSNGTQHLGIVRGLVVDSRSGQPRYLVVDAGGWSASKQYLVEVGRATFDASRDAFLVSLSAAQISRFPGFATDKFGTLDALDVRHINDQMRLADEPVVGSPADDLSSLPWSRPSDQIPAWWSAASTNRTVPPIRAPVIDAVR